MAVRKLKHDVAKRGAARPIPRLAREDDLCSGSPVHQLQEELGVLALGEPNFGPKFPVAYRLMIPIGGSIVLWTLIAKAIGLV